MSTTFTTEDLHEIAYRGSYNDMERDLARALLAAHEQEPIGYLRQGEIESKGYANIVNRAMPEVEYTIPCYTHPAPSVPAAVPEGYALLPLKPTKEMLVAAEHDRGTDWQDAVDIWDSMCRAAMLTGDKN